MGLLKLYDSRLALRGFAAAAIATFTVALFGPAQASLYAFPALGFCLSVMWSIVFSLALNSLPSHHGAFSGILCTGIVGGAVVPLAVGWLGDHLRRPARGVGGGLPDPRLRVRAGDLGASPDRERDDLAPEEGCEHPLTALRPPA